LTLAERIGPAWRRYQVEICWWFFVALNVAGILIFREWATVPFHFIWISMSLLYGWRVWGLPATAASLAIVIVATGSALGADVIIGDQAPDELTEIPLMSAVFATMVLFVRRSVAARVEISRVYEHNVRLLDFARHLIRHASHIVRTPLTIALGHAEILQRTTPDASAARDAQVVIDELVRLKHTTDRMLELATSHQSDFVRPVDTPLLEILADATDRWSADGARVRLGQVDDTMIRADAERLEEAVDELIGNAVTAAPAAEPIEVSARRDGGCAVIAVADRGPGIREDDSKPIFDRFTRADGNCKRGRGARLGLAIVKAIAEAHGGSVRIGNRPGGGAIVELRLPLPAGGPEAAGTPMASAGAAPGAAHSD
jgi:signal transduction histidine kinase